MKTFIERYPELMSNNPGGSQDPLGESILDHHQTWMRIFEPQQVSVVIGRNQNPNTEVNVAHTQADHIPLYRRVSGGGTVVLAPGTVVLALRLRQQQLPIESIFALINGVSQSAIASITNIRPICRGHGDLALEGDDGVTRKILGASLRQTKDAVYYLGVFLVNDCTDLMDRYLQFPSKQPDYRGDRSHGAFCAKLSDLDVSTVDVMQALTLYAQQDLSQRSLL